MPPVVIVQTLVVADVNVTAKLELAVADKVGVVPKFFVPGLLNVIVCGVLAGVTEFDAAEAVPVPIPLVAVTVKVYAVPFARPATVIGVTVLPVLVPVKLPGVDVTV